MLIFKKTSKVLKYELDQDYTSDFFYMNKVIL